MHPPCRAQPISQYFKWEEYKLWLLSHIDFYTLNNMSRKFSLAVEIDEPGDPKSPANAFLVDSSESSPKTENIQFNTPIYRRSSCPTLSVQDDEEQHEKNQRNEHQRRYSICEFDGFNSPADCNRLSSRHDHHQRRHSVALRFSPPRTT